MIVALAPAIRARGLGKDFETPGSWRDVLAGRRRRVVAVSDLDLDLAPGDSLAIMGANGSGKTTLLRLLVGLLLPTRGEVTVLGSDTRTAGPALRARASLVLGDERSFSYRLSGRQNLEFFAALHGLGPRAAGRRAGELLERFGLAADRERPFREYSTGMRQRLILARGLVGAPELLLLDEPTRALDPATRAEVWRLVRDDLIGRDGATVVLATHDAAEAAAVCERLAVMEGGRLREAAGATAPAAAAPAAATEAAARAPGTAGAEGGLDA